MGNPDSPEEKLAAIKARFSDSTLGNWKEYCALAEETGLQKLQQYLKTIQLHRHYSMVKKYSTVTKKQAMLEAVGQEYLDKTVAGLNQWVTLSADDHVQWGWFMFKK